MLTVELKKTALSLLSMTLLLGGSVMLYKDFNSNHDLGFTYHNVDAALVKDLQTVFPIEKVGVYDIIRNAQTTLQLTVATYQDQQKQSRQALIFPLTKTTHVALDIASVRGQAWNAAAQTILKHSDDQALFLTWWDNAQRLHLMTGRESWASSPVAEGFPKPDERAVWQALSGGFDQDSTHLKQLADWLTMDAELALQQIKTRLTRDQQAYFLITVEDLARLKEIAALSGKSLAFQTRIFASTDNMHSLITQVKDWAKQDSTGSYMVHTIPGIGVRAWRIKDSATENSLLARLLPFTHALEAPLDGLDLVYRSERGAYLTLYRLNF